MYGNWCCISCTYFLMILYSLFTFSILTLFYHLKYRIIIVWLKHHSCDMPNIDIQNNTYFFYFYNKDPFQIWVSFCSEPSIHFDFSSFLHIFIDVTNYHTNIKECTPGKTWSVYVTNTVQIMKTKKLINKCRIKTYYINIFFKVFNVKKLSCLILHEFNAILSHSNSNEDIHNILKKF